MFHIPLYNRGDFVGRQILQKGPATSSSPPQGLLQMELAREPDATTVVTAIFTQATVEMLNVKPDVFSAVPLEHGKPVAGPDRFDDSGTTPRSGVPAENDAALNITPVDLNLHSPEGESGKRWSDKLLSRG